VHLFSNTLAWKEALLVETIAFWAVPIFFMLTGATLLKYREKYDTKTFFKKRVLKTFIPFIAWSLIMFLWRYLVNPSSLGELSPVEVVNIFLNNKMLLVYWFFFPLFAVYLCIPVLSLLITHRKILWYMVCLSFLTYSVFPVLSQIVGIQWNFNLSFPLTGGAYVTFAILGYLLSTENLNLPIRISLYFSGFVCVLIRYFYTYFQSIKEGVTNTLFFNYNHFTSVLLAVAVFVFFKHTNWDFLFNREWLGKLLRTMGSCSFGIYLIHMFVITYEVRFTGISEASTIWRTLGPIATFTISLGIIYVLKRTPYLNKLVP
jgi:surface polysaccharide O-acyltransferase-like enzyme